MKVSFRLSLITAVREGKGGKEKQVRKRKKKGSIHSNNTPASVRNNYPMLEKQAMYEF